MLRPSIAAAILGALQIVGCSPASDHRPIVEARRAFAIDLPKDCAMTGGQRRLDFAVFQVNCGEAAKVGVYVGNWPNIDPDDQGLALRSDIPGRDVIVAAKDPDEVARGYLWTTKYRWPSRIHVWIEAGQQGDELAKRIAASVQPTDPEPRP